jgi:hypothetical protein
MTRRDGQGECDKCHGTFGYRLIHNGFNASSYAYCSKCGMTAVIDTNNRDRTAEGFPPHRSITSEAEPYLAPCTCGGEFQAGAVPRCPHCKKELSATKAAAWIEANAPGTKKSWKWQNDWVSLYAIVIDERFVANPLKAQESAP